MVNSVACELAEQISKYCECDYPCEYVEIWTVRCNTNFRDVVLTGRLIPTNAQQGTNLMQAMSQWLETGRPFVTINNEQVTVDKQCDVAIDYPYATDCTAGKTGSALGGSNDDDDDDDDSSTGAIVGGLIAGLLIICITIVVVVLIFQVFKRKQQKYVTMIDRICALSYGSKLCI